jgi:hypothetical protein
MRTILSLACVLGLTACSPEQKPKAPEPAPAPQPSAAAAAAEPIDPFLLGIETGRWQVLIERATSGADQAPMPAPAEEADTLSIDRSLKQGASDLLALRDTVCARNLLPTEKCTIPDWPAWTTEPVTAATPLETLQQRSDWLGSAMSDFVDAGCAAGKAALKDDMFCSVE